MKVLIGCEESQILCTAFRDLNIQAFSCDIKDTQGNPDWHYKMDINECLTQTSAWDLIILHPPCTALCLSGNRWYGKGMPKHNQRIKALNWTLNLWTTAINKAPHVAMENPMSVLFKYLVNVQYVHPWMFGEPVKKTTGFALHNLPRLKPTKIVKNPTNKIHHMPGNMQRRRKRSKTFIGLARAIAQQWSAHIIQRK